MYDSTVKRFAGSSKKLLGSSQMNKTFKPACDGASEMYVFG